MVTRTRHVEAPPEQVWKYIEDGWFYALWMVGATAVRQVDDTWPAAGSQVEHLTGTWPLALHQRTTVLECDAGRRLVVRPHVALVGDSTISVTVRDAGAGSEVALERQVETGIRRLVPDPVKRPVLNAWTDDCLRRLSYLAERRR